MRIEDSTYFCERDSRTLDLIDAERGVDLRGGAVETYTVGRRALQTRDTVMEGLEALLAPGYELAPDTPAIAAEAIGGAIYALIYDQVKNNGAESLPELARVRQMVRPPA